MAVVFPAPAAAHTVSTLEASRWLRTRSVIRGRSTTESAKVGGASFRRISLARPESLESRVASTATNWPLLLHLAKATLIPSHAPAQCWISGRLTLASTEG